MGAYTFIAPRLQQLLPKDSVLEYVGRIEAAAPATGISKRHKAEHEEVLNQALVI
jgi:2-oxoglutarate dehydrogenase complex dehydrogenase (E1) component-like enzyme